MAFDSPQHVGTSIETYEFISSSRRFNYTSYRQDVTHQGIVYEAIPITHSNYQRSLTHEEKGVTITLPVDIEFAQQVLFRTSLQNLFCNIYLQNRLNAEGLSPEEGGRFLVWKGRILSFKVVQSTVSLILYNFLADALRQTIPKVYYQSQCNHVLYDNRCRVKQEDFQKATTIRGQNRFQLILADEYPDNWLAGGYVRRLSDGEVRLITSNSAHVVTIPYPMHEVEEGQSVHVYAGCDHTLKTCREKFNNQPNFGGFPTVPYKNIFRTGVIG